MTDRAANPPLVAQAHGLLAARSRWSVLEIAFWLAAFASIFLLQSKHLILTEIAILALFALSLDLLLGYAGIVSLGHAAFFGFGAYCAGILAKYGIIKEPVLALLASGLAAMALGFVTSFLVLRGSDLTRLMVTLGVALVLREVANQLEITGGADGLQGVEMQPILGHFAFDIFGKTAYIYSLVVLFIVFLIARRIVHSPFGLSLRSVKGNPLRASAVGIHVNGRLVAIYTIAAGMAGIAGALLTQATQFASLSVLDFERSADVLLILIIGGAGYLYGGLIGAVLFKLVQDYLANVNPQYWQFWLGLMLVMMILFGRVYGAVMAALIFAVCTVAKLPFMQSIIFTVVVVMTLGLARPHVLKLTSAITERAVALQAGLKARFARKGSNHAPGA
ncbi:MAG TPA: branched-chain amino acid ABC transporter permease [Xanthobacteraceae bacterium]|nr:branched-chain amino acid ABC transporter permease [Xanthobacteraceae bacterium]